MSESVDVLDASVGELLAVFRDSLVALVPLAIRSKLPWGDDDTHVDWERLAVASFQAFVSGPLSADQVRGTDDFPLAPYDIDLDSFGTVSWIAADAPGGPDLVLIRFVSVENPFDSVQLVEVDPVTKLPGKRVVLPWGGLTFSFVRRSASNQLTRIRHISADD